MKKRINKAAALLGSQGGRKPKHYSPEELARRAEQARGLAAIRWGKRKLETWYVIDPTGKVHHVRAVTRQSAIDTAKAAGIRVVGVKLGK